MNIALTLMWYIGFLGGIGAHGLINNIQAQQATKKDCQNDSPQKVNTAILMASVVGLVASLVVYVLLEGL